MGVVKLMRQERRIAQQINTIEAKLLLHDDIEADVRRLTAMVDDTIKELAKLQAFAMNISNISNRAQNLIERKAKPMLEKVNGNIVYERNR